MSGLYSFKRGRFELDSVDGAFKQKRINPEKDRDADQLKFNL